MCHDKEDSAGQAAKPVARPNGKQGGQSERDRNSSALSFLEHQQEHRGDQQREVIQYFSGTNVLPARLA